MEYLKLKDVADIHLGLTHTPKYVDSGIPFLSVKDISGGNIDFSNCHYITEEEYNTLPKGAKPECGDMLFCRVGTIGKPIIIKENVPKFGSFVSLGFLRRKNNEILLNYLKYWMNSNLFYKQVKQNVKGVAQINLNTTWLKEFDIPKVSLKEQKKIVDKLSKVDKMICIKKNEIEKLNQLIKSQFVEMFENKDYPLKTLDSISLKKGEYGAGSASIPYNCNRPRYVRITDINEDGTLNNDCVSSIEENDDITYKLEYGDFMFARMGATVGKTYAFEKGNQIFAGYLIRFKLNIDIVNPKYLFWFTKTTKYNEWVKLNQSGAAQPGINAKKYGSLEIPIPPIELQNKFAQIVEQIDKQKFEFENSLKKLEELQASLMQEYFG